MHHRAILTAGIFLALLGGFAVIYPGAYDVAATAPHWPVTRWIMETARIRSIKAHAAGIQVGRALTTRRIFPSASSISRRIARSATAPPACRAATSPRGFIRRRRILARTVKFYSDGELFWIVKNGIKMTGMPAWSDHSDAELWATVAFVKKLPGMTEQDYARLVMANMAHGGHHGGDQDQTKHDDHSHH